MIDRYEAGIVLQVRVKSIRVNSAINLKESYVDLTKGEAWLIGSRVSPCCRATETIMSPTVRKLLLNKAELHKLARQVKKRNDHCAFDGLFQKEK